MMIMNEYVPFLAKRVTSDGVEMISIIVMILFMKSSATDLTFDKVCARWVPNQ